MNGSVEAPGRYREAWKDYKSRLWQFWWALATYIPAGILGYVLAGTMLKNEERARYWALYVGTLWLFLILFSWFRVILWHCPRCGKLYTFKGIASPGPHTLRCVHCGLPKYSIV